jgi:putative endonuclease
MKNKWFVYAILCSNGSVYIGQTNDLLHRWELHKKGKGAQWTKKCLPLKLFYFEEVDSQANALDRERELKKTTGRRMLKRLLQRTHSQAGEPAKRLLERIRGEKTKLSNLCKIKHYRRRKVLYGNCQIEE